MFMKVLYLLRHGDTGLTGRYIGSTDAPLIDEGKRQVQATGRLLQHTGITKVISSPMLRCRQSFQQLGLDLPCDYVESLREIDFGRWEGRNFTEILQSDKQLVESWANEAEDFTFPEGESLAGFRTRVAQFKTELEKMDEEKILVIAHGGIIRYLLCLLLGISLEKYLIFDVKPGRYSAVQLFSEGGVLTGFNIKG